MMPKRNPQMLKRNLQTHPENRVERNVIATRQSTDSETASERKTVAGHVDDSLPFTMVDLDGIMTGRAIGLPGTVVGMMMKDSQYVIFATIVHMTEATGQAEAAGVGPLLEDATGRENELESTIAIVQIPTETARGTEIETEIGNGIGNGTKTETEIGRGIERETGAETGTETETGIDTGIGLGTGVDNATGMITADADAIATTPVPGPVQESDPALATWTENEAETETETEIETGTGTKTKTSTGTMTEQQRATTIETATVTEEGLAPAHPGNAPSPARATAPPVCWISTATSRQPVVGAGHLVVASALGNARPTMTGRGSLRLIDTYQAEVGMGEETRGPAIEIGIQNEAGTAGLRMIAARAGEGVLVGGVVDGEAGVGRQRSVILLCLFRPDHSYDLS